VFPFFQISRQKSFKMLVIFVFWIFSNWLLMAQITGGNLSRFGERNDESVGSLSVCLFFSSFEQNHPQYFF